MERIKEMSRRLGNWQYTGLCLMVLLTLVMHFSIIMQPAEPAFDEQYYVTDARYILNGQGSERIEHPPLSKLLIVSGISVFGDNPLGWRFFSVVFGEICIVLFYLICSRLGMSRKSAFLATFLLAFENLGFVQAGIAMLDVYSLAFVLASFYFYLDKRYLTSGIAAGFSVLTKLSGALTLPVIFLHWLFTRRTQPRRFLAALLSAPATFLLLMPLFDLAIWHKFVNPITETGKMLSVIIPSTFAKYPSEMLSRPWEWVLQPKIITYWLEPHYIGMISPTIWALIIPAVLYITFRAIKGNNTAIFTLSWFASTYLFWIPVNLITDRISYVYYFYPTIGAICIGIAMGLSRLSNIGETGQTGKLRKSARLLIPVYLLLHLVAFVIMAPVSYWWKVPACIIIYACARWQLQIESSQVKQEENVITGT